MPAQHKLFSSGSTLLDLVLGGGWALERIFNIVGDKSTGKTLLAIEGMANFKRTFPNGRMRYAEAEAAFDTSFAQLMGFPAEVEQLDGKLDTVEQFDDDLAKFTASCGKDKVPGLYILDSLDALTDEAEIEKAAAEAKAREKGTEVSGSFGAAKAKRMSQLFRRLARQISESNCALGIISQIRDRIGVTFGEHYTRSGGHALDFYASQVIWLTENSKEKADTDDGNRATGVNIHARCKKNKVGMPFRECDFSIVFMYGVDDEISMLEWLKSTGKYETATARDIKKRLKDARNKEDYTAIVEIHHALRADTIATWQSIEDKLKPRIQKYRTSIPTPPTPLKAVAEEAKKAIDSVVATIEEKKISSLTERLIVKK